MPIKALLALLAAMACGLRAQDKELFVTPEDGHAPVIAAVAGAAGAIDMTMYHLSDPKVVRALLAARRRGVEVRILLDPGGLRQAKFAAVARRLEEAGVQVRAGSPAFSLTHEKALVIDRRKALILSMNLTRDAADTRDYGVATTEPGVVAEMESVFAADWRNAQAGTADTPALARGDLLWSPVNSRSGLKKLAGSARHDLIATVENLGDRTIERAMIRAASRGARVRLIVPMCDLNKDPLFNYPMLERLKAGGVDTKVMPAPATPRHPYMHAKMMVADGERAYIGSVNFSPNSTTRSRELGILFEDAGLIRRISGVFETDWKAAVPVPDPPPSDCPALVL